MESPRRDVPLSELTTLRLGGPARELLEPGSTEELAETVRTMDLASRTDHGEPLLIAGGSNLVIADEGWDGPVIAVRTRGIQREADGERVTLRVAAGEPWDELVASCVADGLAGFECLSGIPGSSGATPIQNVGAYGQEVSQTITEVRTWDREERRFLTLAAEQCGFRYRDSAFKGSDRQLVLEVVFELERSELSRPIAYAQLAEALGVEIGERAPLADVREAILGLRRGKGMVIDPADPDSVSAGSFFTNPILAAERFERLRERVAERLGPGAEPPGWPEEDGRVKTSAAWLLQHAGFGRGYGDGRAGVSSKHSLALINRGGASTAELVALARELRDGVSDAFAIELVPEPTLVGVSL